jgi:hypothetical protein
MVENYSFDIESIPSVYESNNLDLRFVAADLISGLKIIEKEQSYIVGNLALSEGVSPHRNINASPDEIDYNLLMKAALLVGSQKLGNPITVTTGFPFSTFNLFKDLTKNHFLGEHTIQFDTGTFTNGSIKKLNVEVDQVQVMPEVIGCALGIRRQQKINGNFFILSLGYGTLEGILSKPSGMVQRSSLSVFGIRYAVNLMRIELSSIYYLDMKNEHQLDVAFREASIVLNRKRIDLTSMRRKVLRQYYNDVISPALRKAFDDNDFAEASKMYLAGGGALYQDLKDFFDEEFEGIVNVELAKQPEHLAAIGYCYQSILTNNGDRGRAVGIDIGNSSTVICTVKKENEVNYTESESR